MPQEKERSIPDDLGRSIQSVQTLQRKLETFEREVAALGTKVSNSTAEIIWQEYLDCNPDKDIIEQAHVLQCHIKQSI